MRSGSRDTSVTLVLPAYNEAKALKPLFEELAHLRARERMPTRVVVIDDGSTDETPLVVQQWADCLPINYRRHPTNQGLGRTLYDGLSLAAELSEPDAVIVTMDADHTHPVELIPRLVEKLKEGFDVVIASRYQPGARVMGLSRSRRLLSRGASALYRLAFRHAEVRDYTSGFRAYRAVAIRNLLQREGHRLLTEQGFASTAQLLLKLLQTGARATEIPLVLRYDRKPGCSKMRICRTTMSTLGLVAKTVLWPKRSPTTNL